MKKIIFFNIIVLISLLFVTSACSDFEELNTKPTAANENQVQVEYFINNSIIGAQQNPHVAERAFVLYWKSVGRMDRIGTLSTGGSNDGWTTDYFNSIAGWLGNANTAIDIANSKITKKNEDEYTANLLQVARIWRVYLMSELTDMFGSIPLDGFKGVNPDFNSVQEVYTFMLKELKEATNILDSKIKVPERVAKLDPAYAYDFSKWKKYGNSMRMRLAMRLSEVDSNTAKAEFEDAVKGNEFISTLAENFKVAEKPGWNDLSGVMSREWNMQYLSVTTNNLYIGLGGITSEEQLPMSLHSKVKAENWLGVKYDQHFATVTNDPSAGYWFDGLHKKIDPRAYKAYIIPGDFENKEYNGYPSWSPDATSKTERALLDANGKDTLKLVDAAFSWNAAVIGSWGDKGSNNKLVDWPGAMPRLANKFRNSSESRIFFASWESHFLIAEAAVRGWTVPMTGQVAYEKGIQESFSYWGVSDFATDYVKSEDYNRVGTSVKWGHTAEPTSVEMQYKDGYTGEVKTITYKYPKNNVYKKGTVSNDHLTKIITQKFIAQVPWVPLETWSDHRRLGLPFFENPAVEKPLTNMPNLTPETVMEARVEFYPQRVPYPSFLSNNVPKGYQQAVEKLKGEDNIYTVLWWAMPK